MDMKKRGEYGEFFPASMSPFGYNETVAHEYFPLSKEEITKGFVPPLPWTNRVEVGVIVPIPTRSVEVAL